jgi:hypothetical protein
VSVELSHDQLAELCFKRVPDDVVGRDVVLAALGRGFAAVREIINVDRTVEIAKAAQLAA